jgi:hypothetical protein
MTALLAALVIAGGPALTYEMPKRVAYVDAALKAVRAANRDLQEEAYQYVLAIDRGACSASAVRLKVECMMTAARRFCRARDANCPPLMDVVVSNVLAEQHFVSTDRRYEIMKRYRDYRAEVRREIRRIQGALAVAFHLHEDPNASPASLAERIDSYCVATADKSNLSWQTCASSLVWFIGTSGVTGEEG